MRKKAVLAVAMMSISLFVALSLRNAWGELKEANYFTINGKSAPAVPPLKVKKGEKIRVRFINAGNQVHPMHLHGHVFKIISTDGYPLSNKGQWKDTLPVNAGERSTWCSKLTIQAHGLSTAMTSIM